ncbi:MAG: hypothetical protein HYV40_02110 [Candidatus Levybacteria bacterium]|nr:hypothetical protein [Candidatus Levybacteria bacterium]
MAFAFIPVESITDEEALEVDFFHDFLVFLRYVQKQPIKRTVTGNISLHDIHQFRSVFKQQKTFKEFDEMNWKISTERQVQVLHQIRIMAETMQLIYKRRDKFLLSKNGSGYLHNISSAIQYGNMVTHFWRRVNWGYFSPGKDIDGLCVAEVLQDNQDTIWSAFLKNGEKWVNFAVFCQTLKHYFALQPYYAESENERFDLFLDIEYGLFYRNLIPFGCIEIEKKIMEHGIARISQFRATKRGLFLFHNAGEFYW